MSRVRRRKAVGMEALIRDYLGRSGLGRALDLRRICKAWEEASGAGRYTSRVFFKSGTLYATMSSSVARSQLLFRKDELTRRINSILAEDPLFNGAPDGEEYVKELIIK